MSQHQTETLVAKLQTELNQAKIKHSEAIYWLELELNTSRQSTRALEDRMATLYRDMQDLEKPQKPRLIKPDAEYMAQQQKQIDKYERMLRVMNNQVALVRSSSDTLVKSLKDEIADLMDDKVKFEMTLMNKLSALDKEKCDLEKLLGEEKRKSSGASESMKQPSTIKEAPATDMANESPTASFFHRVEMPPKAPCRHKSIEYDDATPPRSPRRQKSNEDDEEALEETDQDDVKRLREENILLKKELESQKTTEAVKAERERQSAQVEQLTTSNKILDSKLTEIRNKSHESLVQWTREKADLEDQIDALKQKMEPLSADKGREVVLASLDRVALLWDRADQSIQGIESLMMEVRPNHPSQDAERALSVLETATLVHGQIKVSLMLIELQFRNSLACLEQDQSAVADVASSSDDSAKLSEQVQTIKQEVMESVTKLETLLDEQIKELRGKSTEEASTIREMHECKAVDLRRLLDRQAELENEIARLQSAKSVEGKATVNAVEMLVSQRALETLQNEVLLVVERVKEKNEMIGRLNAVIEEHKVRERTLMEELKRHMKDQADRQMAEQQRLIDQRAQFDSSDDDSDSAGSSEYEEKTVDATIYEEVTVYDDQTVH